MNAQQQAQARRASTTASPPFNPAAAPSLWTRAKAKLRATATAVRAVFGRVARTAHTALASAVAAVRTSRPVAGVKAVSAKARSHAVRAFRFVVGNFAAILGATTLASALIIAPVLGFIAAALLAAAFWLAADSSATSRVFAQALFNAGVELILHILFVAPRKST